MNSLEAFDKLVEQALEHHNSIIKGNTLPQNATIWGYPLERIRNDLKVLEIIKEKNVNIMFFKLNLHIAIVTERNPLEFHNTWVEVSEKLTPEEFDLIKEWLERK